VSLAHLLGAHGRRDKARELCAGIIGQFTDEFATVDLVETKALLEHLK
jgi:hypothetical protein